MPASLPARGAERTTARSGCSGVREGVSRTGLLRRCPKARAFTGSGVRSRRRHVSVVAGAYAWRSASASPIRIVTSGWNRHTSTAPRPVVVDGHATSLSFPLSIKELGPDRDRRHLQIEPLLGPRHPVEHEPLAQGNRTPRGKWRCVCTRESTDTFLA